jgi:hypothetical protein
MDADHVEIASGKITELHGNYVDCHRSFNSVFRQRVGQLSIADRVRLRTFRRAVGILYSREQFSRLGLVNPLVGNEWYKNCETDFGRNCSPRDGHAVEKAGFGASVSVMAWRADLPLRRPVAMTDCAAA